MAIVFHLQERLVRPGVDQRILDFFQWWQANGPHPLAIPPTGGRRTDEAVQAALYAQGRTAPGPHAGEEGFPVLGLTVTAAATLADTPHGRGGAADAYPVILSTTGLKVAALDLDERNPRVRLKFEHYGLLAEEHGLEWGGRWKRKDLPHCQVRSWRDLPLPKFTST